MLSKKEINIIKLLYENRTSYTTGGCIARATRVSDRTARKYVGLIDKILNEKELASIIAQQGLGFQLHIKNENEFSNFYDRLIAGEMSEEKRIEGPEDRLDYLLNQLFFEQSTVDLDETTEKLFVSDSTLLKDIAKIKKILSLYEIKLKVKGGNNVFVTGEEANIRQFMVDYFFKERQEGNTHILSLYQELLEDINIEDILMIVLNECRDAELKLSDFIVENLVLHIALSINRLKAGFDIELADDLGVTKESLEYRVASKIIDEMTDTFKMTFPETEAVYITMHLQSKATPLNTVKPQKAKSLKEEIVSVLDTMTKKSAYPLNEDEVLIENLILHFKPLLGRLKYDKTLANPLLEEIKAKYPVIFRLTSEEFEKTDSLKEFKVSEDEWAYVTLHIIASVEKYLNKKRLNVALIGGSGAGHAQFMKEKIEYEFGSKLFISEILNYYDARDADLTDIELIISAANTPLVMIGIPTVHISALLTEEDLDKINEELQRHKAKRRAYAVRTKHETWLVNQEKKQEIVANSFSEDIFFFIMDAVCKDELQEKMAMYIEKKEEKPVKERLLKQLALRETYSSVAFSQDVAIPHPIEAVTAASYVAVAIIPNGLYWDAFHPSVKLVFLVSPNRRIASELEAITQLLIPIVHDDVLKRRLLQSKDFKNFIQLLADNLEI